MALVEAGFRESIDSQVELIQETARWVLESPGKRLRPGLVFLSAGNNGASEHSLVQYALAVELTHTASLVHDDVLDESRTRRGRPTVNWQWGNEIALLLGDYFFAKSANAVARTRDARMIELLADATAAVCEGEMLELLTAGSPHMSVEDYYQRVGLKTARLMAAACEGGGTLANFPDSAVVALRRYGQSIGLVFQVVDDILDLTADEAVLGKPVGSDLRQGLLTLPIILAMEADAECRQAVAQAMASEAPGRPGVDHALALVRASPAVEQAYQEAVRLNEEAKAYLEAVPAPEVRAALAQVADHLLRRER